MPMPAIRVRKVHVRFHFCNAVADEGQQMIRMRVAIGPVPLLADLAGKIHEHDVGAAAADLDAKGKGGVRIDEHRHGGLPDAAADRLAAHQEFVAFE